MEFDWNSALDNLTKAWTSIETSKAGMDIRKLDARTTGTNGRLYRDGTVASTPIEAAMPWLLIGGGLLLVVAMVRK